MHNMVRRLSILIISVACVLIGAAQAAEFKLTTGETLTGEAVLPTANDQGIQIKIGEGDYKKVSWGSFSQDDLKNFAKNGKIQPFVEPFIEVNPEEKIKRTEVNIKEPVRLEQPPRTSLLGAMFSSSLGFFMLLLAYAASVYAAYEVSIFRAQPAALVCGLGAIPGIGLLSTIVFLCLPTKIKPSTAPADVVAEPPAEGVAAAAAAKGDADINPMHADGAVHPTTLKLAAEPEKKEVAPEQPVVFQRGQYTFNRRFFETKFAGFFGVVRRDADKDMMMVVKSNRGLYESERISRIAANDLHLQIKRGHATEEVLIPFQEIQEIQLKRKPEA